MLVFKLCKPTPEVCLFMCMGSYLCVGEEPSDFLFLKMCKTVESGIKLTDLVNE